MYMYALYKETGLLKVVKRIKFREKKKKVFSERRKRRDLIISNVASPGGPLPICSYDAPGVKIDPALGVKSTSIGTKKANFRILLL